MTTQFAPGPWTTEHDGHGGMYVGGRENVQIGFVSNNRQQEANARLIAAAPELAISNKWLLSTLRAVLAGNPVRDADEAISFAESTLAKATGSSAS